ILSLDPTPSGYVAGLYRWLLASVGTILAKSTNQAKITDYKEGWPHQSAQYQKAMRTSFDWAFWPPQKEKDKEFGQDSVLILRDGTELPSGGSAIGYRPGLEKRSLCGRE